MMNSFPGQYVSTSHKDYGAKKVPGLCTSEALPKAPDFSNSTAYFNPIEKLYYV